MEAVDEWLLQSLRLYRDLHTFELQAPTRLIEWARGSRVCVAGYGQSDGNEILQLIPPPTLLTKETQVGVAAMVAPDLSDLLGLIFSETRSGLGGLHEVLPVAVTRTWPGTEQLWLKGKACKSPGCCPVMLSCSCSADSLGCGHFISRCVNESISWGKRTHENSKGLCPERDFKVECGGFSERPVYSLKYVPDTSLLVTSGPPDSSLQVWQVSAEDSASGGSEELSSLAFLDCNTLLLCCTTGRLCLADIRQPQSLVEAVSVPSAPCSEQWCMGTRHGAQGLEPSSQPVARLSNRGLLTLTDLRKTSEFLALAKARVPSPGSGAEFLCVSWAPALEGCLAISGFDGTVHVYDTQSWDSSGKEAEPIFVHKGHAFGGAGGSGDSPLVTVHTWHLQKPRTLLSAASDGSLHVWDWVQPCGKGG
ncbi:WD repeat-containing protein 73 isoform X4 [Aphelocoma coerulescens]|uniref:WD repeat-containing protein 73 isoform X4 n=1 Tax=Aphelocoma coerulescens TaxID=39617 RepID=UPI00360533A9